MTSLTSFTVLYTRLVQSLYPCARFTFIFPIACRIFLPPGNCSVTAVTKLQNTSRGFTSLLMHYSIKQRYMHQSDKANSGIRTRGRSVSYNSEWGRSTLFLDGGNSYVYSSNVSDVKNHGIEI